MEFRDLLQNYRTLSEALSNDREALKTGHDASLKRSIKLKHLGQAFAGDTSAKGERLRLAADRAKARAGELLARQQAVGAADKSNNFKSRQYGHIAGKFKEARQKFRELGKNLKSGKIRVTTGHYKGDKQGAQNKLDSTEAKRRNVRFSEAYDPKREPAERDKESAESRQRVIKDYQGREHKSGRSTRPLLQSPWLKAVPIKGQSPGRGRRGGLGHGDDLSPSWAKRDKKAYQRFERQTARKDIEKDLEPDEDSGVRKGLSQGKPSGFSGKTAKETRKNIDNWLGNRKEAARWKANRSSYRGQTQQGPKKTPFSSTKESPSLYDVTKRAEDPAEAAKAKQGQADAIARYKAMKKAKKGEARLNNAVRKAVPKARSDKAVWPNA